MLALAELLAFDRMASDARLAPDLHRRAVLSEMAAHEINGYDRLAERLTALGVDPESAMAPFIEPLRDYHAQTQPGDWHEALTKAFVGDSFADDFMREAAASLDAPDRGLVLDVLHKTRHADFAARELRASIAADPKLASRLSMWARRMVGEGLSQATRVATERPALAALFMTADASAGGVPAMLKRLTAAHTARMAAVGLNN